MRHEAPMILPSAPIPTPCVGICELDDAGLCLGCLRTRDEIARWGVMPNAERLHVIEVVLPARAAAQ